MSFVLEFIGDIIAKCMEDPEYNKKCWDEHILAVEKLANKRLETWQSPTYAWGFWRNKVQNAIYEQKMHPAYKQYPGRRSSEAEY
eukprot:g2336.t1